MGTVCGWVGRIYKRNDVHGREELRGKLVGEMAETGRAAG
jgi:hypothetical protein